MKTTTKPRLSLPTLTCPQVVSRYVIILEAEGMEHSLGRMYLTYCILALALGDYVRADMAFRNVHLQSTA